MVKLRKCYLCYITKPITQFHKNKTQKTGYNFECKSCKKIQNKEWRAKNRDKHLELIKKWKIENREYFLKTLKDWKAKNPEKVKHYRDKRLEAMFKQTPKWASIEKIAEFYKNCPKGYVVDHIIPLQGKNVSGFHSLENLQYLTKEENLKKNNKV